MNKLLLLFVSLCVSCLTQAQNYLCFTAESDNSSVGVQMLGYGDTLSGLDVNVQYSVDGGVTWNAVYPQIAASLNKGDKIYIKGENPNGFSSEGRWVNFFMTGSISASGSVMSLIDGLGTATQIPNSGCFGRLFLGCQSLIDAPELPATGLTESCYADMFCKCSALKKAPALPAMDLKNDCYLNMFSNCSSLTQAPDLPATTLAEHCYHYMFNGCKNLIEAPDLPATQMAPYCYTFMFENCTSLSKAPVILPSTELAEACYRGMFEGCSNLAEAPALPATELASRCYWEMFYGCVSLKGTPYLPAFEIKEWSYYQMFEHCSSLNYVEVALPTWSLVGNNTFCWLKDVASAGKFVCPIELEEKFGESYIPGGWNVVHSNSVNDFLVTVCGILYSYDGHLFVDASEKGVACIFNLGGQLIKTVSYGDGVTDLGAFPAGVYVVNGQKVVVK